MRIIVKTSGGLANISRTSTVDTTTLAPEEAADLEAQVAAAGLRDLPGLLRAPISGADRLTYEVTLEDQERRHIVKADEGALSERLLELIHHVRTLARTKQG